MVMNVLCSANAHCTLFARNQKSYFSPGNGSDPEYTRHIRVKAIPTGNSRS